MSAKCVIAQAALALLVRVAFLFHPSELNFYIPQDVSSAATAGTAAFYVYPRDITDACSFADVAWCQQVRAVLRIVFYLVRREAGRESGGAVLARTECF